MSGGHGGGGGDERWLITYADLLTLLVAYFIVMFAIGQTDLEKFEKLSASTRQAFAFRPFGGVFGGAGGAGGAGVGGAGLPGGSGVFDGFPAVNRGYIQVSSEVAQLAQEQGLMGSISANTGREGIVISISSSVLFDSGQAQVRPESRATLAVIAGLLQDMPNEVRVAGHTDNVSPFPQWPSNWELSAARAIQVVKYLSTEGNLEPQRLSAIGYGAHRPLYPNDTPAHRRLNRRVDILIVYETVGEASTGLADFAPIEGLPTPEHK